MSKYVLTAYDEVLQVYTKKPTSDELIERLDNAGYSTEEVELYEVAREVSLKRTISIVDKKGDDVV